MFRWDVFRNVFANRFFSRFGSLFGGLGTALILDAFDLFRPEGSWVTVPIGLVSIAVGVWMWRRADRMKRLD